MTNTATAWDSARRIVGNMIRVAIALPAHPADDKRPIVDALHDIARIVANLGPVPEPDADSDPDAPTWTILDRDGDPFAIEGVHPSDDGGADLLGIDGKIAAALDPHTCRTLAAILLHRADAATQDACTAEQDGGRDE